jgi:CDP-glycerol glycerophosphotransferase (TagB/SpsB family)
VAFEAVLVKKPLYFWAFDYDEYAEEYGFELDYHNQMPGTVSDDAAVICRAICENKPVSTDGSALRTGFFGPADEGCTTKIVRLIWELH